MQRRALALFGIAAVMPTLSGCSIDDREVRASTPADDCTTPTCTTSTDPGSMTSALADCTLGDAECLSSRERVTCAAGSWTEPELCPGACMDGRCVECSQGARECTSASEYRVCSSEGAWSVASSCQRQACIAGHCAGECEPRATRCNGDAAETCSDEGQWGGGMLCDEGCEGASCLGECEPGAARCFDADEAQTCSTRGQWQTPERCDFVCDPDTRRCGGECLPEDRECRGATPRSCDAGGRWRDEATCATSCVDGECETDCETNESRCDTALPNARQVCVDGAWVTLTACANACRASTSASGLRTAECFGECTPGQRRCDSSRVRQVCSDSYELEEFQCPFVCSFGECTGECVPGSFRCAPDGVNERCDNGYWQRQAACPAGQVCFGVLGQCTTAF